MPHTLKVTIRNFCLFILTDKGAEGWIISDPARHVPRLDLVEAQMKIPDDLKGQPHLDLTGCVVAFGSGDWNQPANELPEKETTSGGRYWGRLLHLDQVFTGIRPKTGWATGRSEPLPADLATKIMLNGGVLTPEVRIDKPGDYIEFTIGSNLEQYLISQTVFSVETADVPFVRVVDKAGLTKNIPLIENKSEYSVRLGAAEITEEAALDLHRDVAFVHEITTFAKALDIPGNASLPIPHCYWPEYKNQTDPDGGPCMQAVLERRKIHSLLAAFQNILTPPM